MQAAGPMAEPHRTRSRRTAVGRLCPVFEDSGVALSAAAEGTTASAAEARSMASREEGTWPASLP